MAPGRCQGDAAVSLGVQTIQLPVKLNDLFSHITHEVRV